LLKSLQAVGGVLGSNNTLPILDDFLFNLTEDALIITASDLETTMTVSIPLTMAEEPGMITVPAKKLLDTLKTFPDLPLTFTINEENQSIEISTGEGKYKLTGHNAEEFPKIPNLDGTASLKINSGILGTAINRTLFAAGNDDLRPVMSGVYCQLSPEDIIFVATDAHKLVRYRRTDIKSDEVASFILPKKPLNQLKGILSHLDEEVSIEYNQTNASFRFSNISLVCRLIDGRYPNYEAVIPKENPNDLSIDRLRFLT